MSGSLKTAGTWAELTADGAVSIPGSPSAGNRMFLFAAWKTYTITASVSGWTPIGAEFADGAVAGGNSVGSMKVMAWYRDWQTGDGNPTIDFSASPSDAAAVIQLWQKDAAEDWSAPLDVTAAWAASSAQTISASSTVAVPDGSVVMGLLGFRDDSALMTRPTTAIDVASGITWNGNHVESPAAHASFTTGGDCSADLGHRFVTTGGTVTLRMTATISASETGSGKWVVQGTVPAAQTVQPAPVAVTAAVPAPTISLAYSVSPVPVPLAPAVPAPSIAIDQAVAPAPVALSPAVPAPAVANVLGLSPAPVAVVAAVPAPTLATPLGLSPSPVVVSSAVPAPTIESELDLSPSPIAAALVVTGSAVTSAYGISPAPIPASTAVPTPTVEVVATISPSPVVLALAVPAPTLGLELALSPSPVAAGLAVPSPTIGLVLSLSPGPVAAMTAVPLPDVEVGGGGHLVSPAPVVATTAVPPPTLERGLELSPSPVAVTLFVPAPILGLIGALSPAPVAVVTAVPAPLIASGEPPQVTTGFLMLAIRPRRMGHGVATMRSTGRGG